ncbi:hypothetical protein [Fontimonas sp. SYSU GA230001]|uniref:hypothetical protein n=1 Tax=Fontimonas sp. SYSU GA230001 TaxID=3142450 RepID=UPI0032B38BB6
MKVTTTASAESTGASVMAIDSRAGPSLPLLQPTKASATKALPMLLFMLTAFLLLRFLFMGTGRLAAARPPVIPSTGTITFNLLPVR